MHNKHMLTQTAELLIEIHEVQKYNTVHATTKSQIKWSENNVKRQKYINVVSVYEAIKISL